MLSIPGNDQSRVGNIPSKIKILPWDWVITGLDIRLEETEEKVKTMETMEESGLNMEFTLVLILPHGI